MWKVEARHLPNWMGTCVGVVSWPISRGIDDREVQPPPHRRAAVAAPGGVAGVKRIARIWTSSPRWR